MRKSVILLLGFALLFNACGKDGAPGINGTNGTNGINGTNGTNGVDGTDGSTILSGTTGPTSNLGSIGDYYLNLSSRDFYGPKTSSGWGSPISLQGMDGTNGKDGTDGSNGANGKDGTKIYNGYGAPASNIGVQGDFYLDMSNYILYGPKGAVDWQGGGLSLKGKDGVSGIITYIYNNPYTNLNALNGGTSFTFSLFPALTTDIVENDAVLVYSQIQAIDTTTGNIATNGITTAWSLLGNESTALLPAGLKGDFGYSIPIITNSSPLIIITGNFENNNIHFFTTNQVRYFSGLSKFKIVIIPPSSINYLSNKFGVNLNDLKRLRKFATLNPGLF